MFTQKEGLNTNKCNGCRTHCVISAFYYTKRGTGYLPVLNNQIKTRSMGQDGTEHPLPLYRTAHDAMNCAKSLARQCKKFKDVRTPPPATTDLDFDRCIGCPNRCMVSSQKIQGVFLPKIGTQLIKRYINTYGEVLTPPTFYNDFKAKMHALKIAKLCDHYRLK